MGTKMMLHRYGHVTKDWEEVTYTVDQVFINNYGTLDPTIPTVHFYEPNVGLLKVYHNGRRLLSNTSYLEVDSEHIKLTLRDIGGQTVELRLGDVILIELHRNHYCSRGQATVSGADFYGLRQEVVDSRVYTDVSSPYKSLDDRLDTIQRGLDIAYGGDSDLDREYEYNSRGQVTKETTTGSNVIVKVLTYYENEEPSLKGELKTETITVNDSQGNVVDQVVKTYFYDNATRRLLRVSVR